MWQGDPVFFRDRSNFGARSVQASSGTGKGPEGGLNSRRVGLWGLTAGCCLARQISRCGTRPFFATRKTGTQTVLTESPDLARQAKHSPIGLQGPIDRLTWNSHRAKNRKWRVSPKPPSGSDSAASLANDFEQANPGSHRNIQGTDGAGHGKFDQVITGFAGQATQARPFRAHDECRRAREITIVEG